MQLADAQWQIATDWLSVYKNRRLKPAQGPKNPSAQGSARECGDHSSHVLKKDPSSQVACLWTDRPSTSASPSESGVLSLPSRRERTRSSPYHATPPKRLLRPLSA
jgi:hypothetical protein